MTASLPYISGSRMTRIVTNLWVFRVDSCKPVLSVVEGFVANLSPRPCEIPKNPRFTAAIVTAHPVLTGSQSGHRITIRTPDHNPDTGSQSGHLQAKRRLPSPPSRWPAHHRWREKPNRAAAAREEKVSANENKTVISAVVNFRARVIIYSRKRDE